MDKYPKGDAPDYNVLPAGPTVTGRWSFQKPEIQEVEPRKVAIIAHAGNAPSAALAALVAMDYSKIELRVMAQMADDMEAESDD